MNQNTEPGSPNDVAGIPVGHAELINELYEFSKDVSANGHAPPGYVERPLNPGDVICDWSSPAVSSEPIMGCAAAARERIMIETAKKWSTLSGVAVGTFVFRDAMVSARDLLMFHFLSTRGNFLSARTPFVDTTDSKIALLEPCRTDEMVSTIVHSSYVGSPAFYNPGDAFRVEFFVPFPEPRLMVAIARVDSITDRGVVGFTFYEMHNKTPMYSCNCSGRWTPGFWALFLSQVAHHWTQLALMFRSLALEGKRAKGAITISVAMSGGEITRSILKVVDHASCPRTQLSVRTQ